MGMDAVGAAGTAWRPVGGARDGAVDSRRWLWTTRPGRKLSPSRARVVHGSGPVHPRPPDWPSTELSPDVGEVCAQGNAQQQIHIRQTVSSTGRNRWRCPSRARGQTRGDRNGDDVDHRFGTPCGERRGSDDERRVSGATGRSCRVRRRVRLRCSCTALSPVHTPTGPCTVWRELAGLPATVRRSRAASRSRPTNRLIG